MKREILFRGKPEDEENIIGADFYYGNLVQYSKFISIKQIETGMELVVKPETVGQFTGLTDKNGVKIFEGDIIESDGRIHKLRDFDDLIELYYWNRECVILEEYTKVIGNIHDI